MLSPKGSSKHSLVTYNSDISDDEHHHVHSQDANPDISDLMSISPTSMESSVHNSNETSPKDSSKLDVQVKPFKKPISSNSLRGLVSYGMDDDDSMGEDNDDDMDNESVSMEKDISLNVDDINVMNATAPDNEEHFNDESRESDNETEESQRGQRDGDLKSHSGVSSSHVKASVVMERPKGNDLAYLLSRQVCNNPDNITVPAPSPLKPPPELEMKIAELRAKALSSRCNPTENILKNKAYRNPSIYEKLIQHMKIDERGTNYPPELYDPYRFGEESYYEVLAKTQDSAERKRLDQEASGASGGKAATKPPMAKTESNPRKTKWDSGTHRVSLTKCRSSAGPETKSRMSATNK